MKTVLNNLWAYIMASLGLDRFCADFRLYLKSHMCFLVYNSILGIFVNTLFMRATGDPLVVMRYNMIFYALAGVSMSLGVLVIRRKSALWSMRIGMITFALTFVAFFIFLNDLAFAMPFIAMLHGVGAGFYWITYSMSLTFYTVDENRDTAMGVFSLTQAVVQLFVPLISGSVIGTMTGAMDGMLGYIVMFSLALVLAVLNLFIGRGITEIKQENRKSRQLLAWKMSVTDSALRPIMFSLIIRGLRDGVFGFLLNLLLFQYVTNESIVGLNTFLCAGAAILASGVYRRIVRPGNRSKVTFYSATVLLAAGLVLFLKIGTVPLLVFAFVNSFFSVFLVNPNFAIYFTVLSSLPKARELTCEFHAVKEYYITFGRVAGITLIMLLPSSAVGTVAAITLLTAAQYLLIFLQDRSQRKMKQRQNAVAAGESK